MNLTISQGITNLHLTITQDSTTVKVQPVLYALKDTVNGNYLTTSDALTPVTPTNKLITESDVSDLGGGDMLKSTYDTNNNGIVDNSEKVNDLTVETAVPSGALFTDTVYDDTNIQAEVALNTAKVGITPQQASDISDNNDKISATGNELEATDLNTLSKLNTIVADATILSETEVNSLVEAVGTIDSQDVVDALGYTPEAEFTKNTAFNKDFGSTAGTVTEGNHDHDSDYVGLTGNQTVAGVKTFSSFPITPSGEPTTDYQAANKKYVDDSVLGAGGYTDEAAQDAVGGILTDTTEIDFNYNDLLSQITANIKSGSISSTKLDSSVNDSLDLADTATQPADLNDYLPLTDVIDEDLMTSNSNTKVPTQQSVKAYADTNDNLLQIQINALTGITDGDKGDITVSASGTNWQIDDAAVTNDKLSTGVNDSLDLADTALQSADISDFETSSELNTRDTNNRNRANHTGTQTADTISDFDAEVSNNSAVAANTAKVGVDDETIGRAELKDALKAKVELGNVSGTLDIDLSEGVHYTMNLTGNVTTLNFTDYSDELFKTVTLHISGADTYTFVQPSSVLGDWSAFGDEENVQIQLYIYDVVSLKMSSGLINLV